MWTVEEVAGGFVWVCKCGFRLPTVHPEPPTSINGNCPKCRRKTNYSECVHRGSKLRSQECETCQGSTRIHVFECAVHGECQLSLKLPNIKQCGPGCKEFQPQMKWAYGITTVPSRFDGTLQRTVNSLAAAGFDNPRLFVDGVGDLPETLRGLPRTQRLEPAGVAGNWVLAAVELSIREPHADRYAIFQDDCVAVGNLRQYLENGWYPERGYLNLYTVGRYEKPKRGWTITSQKGYGAVGLVFDNTTFFKLLGSAYLFNRPKDAKRGDRCIDGGVVDAMKELDYREYCHQPSLLEHHGMMSTMQHSPNSFFARAAEFPGEEFDALQWLQTS